MAQIVLALTGLALLVTAGMWASLRIAAVSDLAPLPASCRRRLHWWQVNARIVYVGCAVLAVFCVAVHLPVLHG